MTCIITASARDSFATTIAFHPGGDESALQDQEQPLADQL
jgi:hypothetical protein